MINVSNESYLSFDRVEHFTMDIHEENFTATSRLVIIDSKNNFTPGTEDSASIAMHHQGLHPQRKHGPFR